MTASGSYSKPFAKPMHQMAKSRRLGSIHPGKSVAVINFEVVSDWPLPARANYAHERKQEY